MLTRMARSVALAATVAAVALAGCGTTHQGGQGNGGDGTHRTQLIVKRDSANGSTVKLAPGDKLELILGSSYWNFRGSSAPGVLRQIGSPVLLKATRACVVGGGCRPKKVIYRAVKAGTAVITAHRVSCGEALACTGKKGSFKLTVVVS